MTHTALYQQTHTLEASLNTIDKQSQTLRAQSHVVIIIIVLFILCLIFLFVLAFCAPCESGARGILYICPVNTMGGCSMRVVYVYRAGDVAIINRIFQCAFYYLGWIECAVWVYVIILHWFEV